MAAGSDSRPSFETGARNGCALLRMRAECFERFTSSQDEVGIVERFPALAQFIFSSISIRIARPHGPVPLLRDTITIVSRAFQRTILRRLPIRADARRDSHSRTIKPQR